MNKKDEVIRVKVVNEKIKNRTWYKVGQEFDVVQDLFREEYWMPIFHPFSKSRLLKSDCTIISKAEEAEEKKWTDGDMREAMLYAFNTPPCIGITGLNTASEIINNYLQSLKNKEQ